MVHTHILFCILDGDYAEPDLWGVLEPLPYKGAPAYIKITPLHLALRYSFLGVSRTEFDSSLAGLSTEGDDLDDLGQEPAAEVDDGSCRIHARGSCFLPLELVGELYEMGARPNIAKVTPKIFASALALTKDTPMYKNALNWVKASFTKVVWRNHPSLSFFEVPIRTSRSWGASNFEANSQEGRQAAEFIWSRFPGHYGTPLSPADSTISCVSPMAEATAQADCDGVEARVLWGKDPHAHLGNAGANTRAREPPIHTSFGKATAGAFTSGSGLGWGGFPGTERNNRVSRAWGLLPPGALVGTKRTTVGEGAESVGAVCKEAVTYPPRLTAEKAPKGRVTAAAGDLPHVVVREEEDKDARDTVKDSTGLSR